jgi:hypothetical protein
MTPGAERARAVGLVGIINADAGIRMDAEARERHAPAAADSRGRGQSLRLNPVARPCPRQHTGQPIHDVARPMDTTPDMPCILPGDGRTLP